VRFIAKAVGYLPTTVTPPPPQTRAQRVADARRREQRFRKNASDKRERGETLLACLFERSADAQAALARLAEGVVGDDQGIGATSKPALAASPQPPRR
jgi:hypothetical protein